MARKPRFIVEGIRHATINGHRLHLRLTDPSEENFLWVNGRSPPLVLDQVAAEFVAFLIDAMWDHQQSGDDESDAVRGQVVERMFRRYRSRWPLGAQRVTREKIGADLDRIFGTILAFANGECPIEAGLETEPIVHDEWAAPARIDLALTYRCNLDCAHCYTGGPRNMQELCTDEWLRVYEILWRKGIPQVVFTGGEPTLRDDLVTLVSEAEEFVTGLVTNGVRLAELAEPLRDASLDYIQVTLESEDGQVHNEMVGDREGDAFERTISGIETALGLGMEVVTNTTLTSRNAPRFSDLLRFGRGLGLKNMACNTVICSGRGKAVRTEDPLGLSGVKEILSEASATARKIGIDLQWYTPTCYLDLNPVDLGFGPKSCSAAAHNMTVQPDGTVLPCQSWPESVGQILEVSFDRIWSHPLCAALRGHDRAKKNPQCAQCAELALCGGGCPLDDFQTGQGGIP